MGLAVFKVDLDSSVCWNIRTMEIDVVARKWIDVVSLQYSYYILCGFSNLFFQLECILQTTKYNLWGSSLISILISNSTILPLVIFHPSTAQRFEIGIFRGILRNWTLLFTRSILFFEMNHLLCIVLFCVCIACVGCFVGVLV